MGYESITFISTFKCATTYVTSINGNVETSQSPQLPSQALGGLLTLPTLVSTSSMVVGGDKIYAASPSKITTASSNMATAFIDAAGHVDPDYTNLNAGNIEGKTHKAGLYKWGGNVHFTSNLTFHRSSTDN